MPISLDRELLLLKISHLQFESFESMFAAEWGESKAPSLSLRSGNFGDFSSQTETLDKNLKKVFRIKKHYESNLRTMIPLSFKERWIIFLRFRLHPQNFPIFFTRAGGHEMLSSPNKFFRSEKLRSYLWMMLWMTPRCAIIETLR